MTSTSNLDDEINHLITLCSYISQTASRIRLTHLSNVSFSPNYIKSYHHELLSMSENVEGSVVLLESLLAIERRKLSPIETKKPRYHYTREELLKLRPCVSSSLPMQIRNSLNQVVERESDQSVRLDKTSWRNIRTILA
jgi:hypothetical protein